MPVLIPDYLDIPAPTDDIVTHLDTRGKGGYRVVIDLIARDSIVSSARVFGMIVFVQSDGHYYRLLSGLTNLDWEDLGDSLGGASGLTPSVIQTTNFTLEQNKINLIDTSASLSGLNASLPIGLIPGTKINITDAKNSFSPEKPLTILHSGYRVNGNLDDFQIPLAKASITFLVIDDGGTELNLLLLDQMPFVNQYSDTRGVAKVLLNCNMQRNQTDTGASANGQNVLIRNSLNVNNVLKVATGQIRVFMQKPFSNTNYYPILTGSYSTGNTNYTMSWQVNNLTNISFDAQFRLDVAGYFDYQNIFISVFGDQ
jgi:hypothetical protein